MKKNLLRQLSGKSFPPNGYLSIPYSLLCYIHNVSFFSSLADVLTLRTYRAKASHTSCGW
ncbi:hypothetical protein KZY67_05365 [Prevotella melaninogenica]|uniref:hypothetical protein n=1 Tax=Prevotella melaninogenica TaxID=28132 RepID=UPI001C5F09C2|nr:hypothetical protein [Prevotella melaninogenica]MBW4742118.1 hypothetical protein [Prevotella melaninogenica]MBW4912076.1 hypothetical protein [Prevotella melaninogenica]